MDHIVCTYEDHPSVRHINKNVKTLQNATCSLLTISEQEVKKDPKLVKLAANYFAGPLPQSINKTIV